MRSLRLALAFVVIATAVPLFGLAARALSGRPPISRDPKIPLLTGLGNYSRKVTTDSPIAQQYFDQGLALLYGFNHEGALRSFRAAADADPSCAMAYWGIAAAFGPDINGPDVAPAALEAGNEASTHARDLATRAADVEKGLIEAMTKRYQDPNADDQLPFDQAYASALTELAKRYPHDPDVHVLRAETLMVVAVKHVQKGRAPLPAENREVVAALNAALKESPNHPMGLHLLIHASEDSKRLDAAAAAADRLRNLAPGIGHLMHMPSHIDIRLGHWQQAVVANERAIAADHAYRRIDPEPGSHLLYMSHSHHMLIYAAMMQGQSEKAARTAEEVLGLLPGWHMRLEPGTLDVLTAAAYEIHLRFGKWDAMLAEPKPAALPFAMAIWHNARGIARAAKKDVGGAKIEQREFVEACKHVPPNLTFRNHRTAPLLSIAEKLLEGEILYREGRVDAAVAALREGVGREDKLDFTDPPLWMQPVRHALGATLLDAGRFAEAEAVYREDLKHNPENGWSLYGLFRSLEMQQKKGEAVLVRSRFEKAWQYADFRMTSSCCCLPGPAHK